MSKKKLFLLGGQDLEMMEIRNLLILNNEEFEDKNLSWGAKLNDYKTVLDKYKDENITIYGIELEADITPTKNYVEIDHHGKNDDKSSSLEQVAEILKIKLNDDQMLIAKNDSRYISGMKCLCATQEKIDEIRAKDRKAQGITQEDEDLAKASLNIALCNKSNYIFSKTSHFSAVSDLAYYKFDNYIIYNDNKIVFYGYKKENILEFLKSQNINEIDFYYGGGNFGFVGIKKNILDKTKIEELLEAFKKVENQDELYSYHTFMLPFRFDKNDKESILHGWEFEVYKENYNERAYFHSFFQESMFTDNEKAISTFYTKNEYKNSEYIICKSEKYKLNLKSVNLRIFNTDIGILSFHLENKNHPELKAILEINDFGRRVYPEYLDYEKKICGLVPNYVKMGDVEEKFEFDEQQTKPNLSKIIQVLLPINKIIPSVDDRMFVISFYQNKLIANELKANYVCSNKWYEYVFVDGDGITVQNKEMQQKLIEKSTYERWQNYGTLYGITKYSFVCLADSEFPLKHMKTMYFQMFSLLLMVRSSLLKFSYEVSNITDDFDKDIAKDVSDIYKRYIQFVSNFYFREITPKDQGLELYEKAIDLLKIERDVKDLDAEIEELHKYIELDENKKRTNSMDRLSMLGSYLLLPSLVVGFFGVNIATFSEINGKFTTFELIIGVVVVAFFVPTVLKMFDFIKGIYYAK